MVEFEEVVIGDFDGDSRMDLALQASGQIRHQQVFLITAGTMRRPVLKQAAFGFCILDHRLGSQPVFVESWLYKLMIASTAVERCGMLGRMYEITRWTGAGFEKVGEAFAPHR
jgi:hypothetical protein